MYQGILLPDFNSLAALKTEHLTSLSAPLDAYWETALIGLADHYELRRDGARIGFYCLNAKQQLVAFYLTAKYARHGTSALAYVIRHHVVQGAFAGTNDPYFLSLCLDIAEKSSVHSLLFHDSEKVSCALDGFDQLRFALASEDDFADIVKHVCAAGESVDEDSIEAGFGGINGYVRSVMDEHRIFVLRAKEQLIATSECRISKTQKPYADLGMIVAEDHRRKGVGSYILARTKSFCYEQNTSPICSCEASNIGSKKAITNAGFVSTHRIVLTEFSL